MDSITDLLNSLKPDTKTLTPDMQTLIEQHLLALLKQDTSQVDPALLTILYTMYKGG